MWESRGACFGIPTQNYVAWWVSAFMIVALHLWTCGVSATRSAVASTSFARAVAFNYASIAIGIISIALHMRQIGPAVLTLTATMASVTLTLWPTSAGWSSRKVAGLGARVERVPRTAITVPFWPGGHPAALVLIGSVLRGASYPNACSPSRPGHQDDAMDSG
ncbi:MAG: carotenoid biosynthesis protein [Phycisphaerales bacterium]|nr:MAG: carotenoid biosynthesis protein [Phycisphaerales bacterium]